jgi:hypothetical protein
VPEAHRVDSEDLVERVAEIGQRFDGAEPQIDTTDADRGRVSPPCVPDHDRGVINARHAAADGAPTQLADRDARTEPDFQYPVGGGHVQQREDPVAAAAVRKR